MFLIDCPWCGTRDQQEFVCGGENRPQRPANSEGLSNAAWADYVFMRDNPKGALEELWQHRHGCRRWFRVIRNTANDRILAVRPIAAAPQKAAEIAMRSALPKEVTAIVRSDRALKEQEG